MKEIIKRLRIKNNTPARLVMEKEVTNQHYKEKGFLTAYGEHALVKRKPKVSGEIQKVELSGSAAPPTPLSGGFFYYAFSSLVISR